MAITSEEHRLCWKILDRKTKGVKFDTNIVFPSKTGMVMPLPMVIGVELKMGWGEVKLPGLDDLWDEALVSRNH